MYEVRSASTSSKLASVYSCSQKEIPRVTVIRGQLFHPIQNTAELYLVLMGRVGRVRNPVHEYDRHIPENSPH